MHVKKSKFRISSKKLFFKYTETNVPLSLLLGHVNNVFGRFGLLSWLIVPQTVMASEEQKNVYIFLQFERKVDIRDGDVLNFFFDFKLHRGVRISVGSMSINNCIESCLRGVSDETALLASRDILLLLKNKPLSN
jgi:hypothetical protein